jgi:hypothetical protein
MHHRHGHKSTGKPVKQLGIAIQHINSSKRGGGGGGGLQKYARLLTIGALNETGSQYILFSLTNILKLSKQNIHFHV